MQTPHYRELDRASRLALVILAVAQSLLLLLLHKAIVHKLWPAMDPRWLYGLYTLALGLPLFFYLGAERWHDRANVLAAGAAGLVFFWLGWHTGGVIAPYWIGVSGSQGAITAQLVLASGASTFIAAFLFRAWREADGQGAAYLRLVDLSWINALTLAYLAMFAGVFWLMLVLWAQLFDVIGISFFKDLFGESEFQYPVTGLVVGFGLVMIRNRVRFISTVRSMCEALIRALLPLAAFILLIFLAMLPFTGVQPLWDTGRGSFLLLALAMLLLFFFNAEFGGAEEGDKLYPKPVQWLRNAAMVVLPVVLGIAAWGLMLRVTQYGWTVERYWALFFILSLGAFALTNAFLILRHRGVHGASLGRYNTGLAVVLAVALVLINTGLLDFRRLAADNQVARLEAGEVAPEDIDVTYMRFTLGRYGNEALEALRSSELATEHPVLVARIDEVLHRKTRWATPTEGKLEDPAVILDRLEVLSDRQPPADLLLELAAQDRIHGACFLVGKSCSIGYVDLNDEEMWVLFSRVSGQPWMAFSQLVRRSSDGTRWLAAGTLGSHQSPAKWSGDSPPDGLQLIWDLAPFLRIGNCAYPLLLELEPQPLASGT